MTSLGCRSADRALAVLAMLALTAASVIPAAPARAGSVLGSRQPSARIRALGSGFAGIIPDQLTDLTLNPAGAWNVESLTINYGIRDPYCPAYPFPVSGTDIIPDFIDTNIFNTNEIRVFGLNAWGLRWAVDTEWRFDHRDECTQSDYDVLERYSDGRFGYRTNENCMISDNNYARLEIASAARLGERTALGIRAGGTFWYKDDKNRRRYMRDRFQYSETAGEYIQYTGLSEDIFEDRSHKLYAGFLEAGLTWRDSGELVVRGGYSKGTYLNADYDLEIDTGYDNYTGEMDAYRYILSEFGEDREGDAWIISALAKKRYSGGLIVLVAGSHERGGYDIGWRNINAQYSWGNYVEMQLEELMLYPGDGTRSRSDAAFRIGKTFELERRIELTPGMHVGYSKERFDESGEVSLRSDMEMDGPSTSVRYSFPVEFERSVSRTDLILPLAIEIRAASFFHIYSGFNVNFTWIIEGKRHTFLQHNLQPDLSVFPDGIDEEGNRFFSSYSATLGFSLRYGEKLFFDMFTGSDIVPDDVTFYHFDLRYVF